MKRIWVAVALALGSAAVAVACDEGRPLPASGLSDGVDASIGHVDLCATPGHEGCPCSEKDLEVECGKLVTRSDEYVTCSMGHSKCDGTTWGACTGNRIVTASLPGVGLGMGGLHPMATTGPCTDPCNPYTCTTVTGSTTDVTDPNVAHTDAGLEIPVGSAPVGPTCYGLFCQRQQCATAGVTTNITGTVYDPAGKNPLYNASVYIPVDPAAPLPPFTDGASCDTCAGAGTLTVVALAQTGPDGKFTLNNVPVGSNIPLVVQMGQWRRKVTLPPITACVDNAVAPAYTRLPRNHTDGDNNQADIPKMAIATGSADPFECMLLKAGIDPAEIDVPSKNTRIAYYKFNGKDRSGSTAPLGGTLTSSLTEMKKYSVIMLPCEGAENNHNADALNLQAYADAGGRVFTTHYSYSWLATPNPKGTASNLTDFYGTADWSRLDVNDYNKPTLSLIDTSFPKGAAFAQWLQNIGATTTLGQMNINDPRHDARSAYGASQRWMYSWHSGYAKTNPPDMLLAMTFNTPVKAAAAMQCGRVVYSDFHVSADALVGGCKTNADCGISSTCTGTVTQGTCTGTSCGTAADCSSGQTCDGAQNTGTCKPSSCGFLSGSCSNNNCVSSRCECTSGSGQCASGLCMKQCAAQTCNAASDCGGTSEMCAGAVAGNCQVKTCTQNSDCASNSCVAGKCMCTDSAQCGSGSCSTTGTAACQASTSPCYDGSQCGNAEVCSGTSGTCGPRACSGTNPCPSGTCVNGSCACTADNQCVTGSTCGGSGYHTCTAKSCTNNNQCGSSGTCDNGTRTCKPKGCSGNNQCGGTSATACVNGSCTCLADSACGTGQTCQLVGACTASACVNGACGTNTSQTCSGAVPGTCIAEPCTSSAQCGGGSCVAGKCTCAMASQTTDCKSGVCQSTIVPGTCTAKTCTAASPSGCGTIEDCSGAAAGACTGKSCSTNADCGTNATCSGGKCACTGNSACGGGRTCGATDCVPTSCAYKCGTTETCNGGTPGTCRQTCSVDSDCAPGYCVGGLCKGCYADTDCSGSGATCSGGSLGTCTNASTFPQSCKQGNLSGQESALEFMLFDLTACVSPDSGQPPAPAVSLNPAIFTLDFSGTCPANQKLTWREVDWQATIPSSASIVFKAQTSDDVAGFSTAQSVAVANATSSTTLPNWDVGLIPFQAASPPVTSKSMLRVTVTLNPTSDKTKSPSLSQWRVVYDCSDVT